MNTPALSAATRAPAAAPGARDAAAEAAAAESLYAHANRLFQAALSAAARAVLDTVIALLQRTRMRVGGAPNADADAGEDRPRPAKDRPGGRRDDAAAPARTEAQAPGHRLRNALVCFGMMLAGVMGGGALAYNLLEELLYRMVAESVRLEAAKSKSAAAIATTETEAGETEAGQGNSGKKLEEAQAARDDAEKQLEQARSERIDAENKSKATSAEYAKSMAEKQRKIDAAEKQLATMRAGERAGAVRQPAPVSSGSVARKPVAIKTGNCVVTPDHPAALKTCLEEFNR